MNADNTIFLKSKPAVVGEERKRRKKVSQRKSKASINKKDDISSYFLHITYLSCIRVQRQNSVEHKMAYYLHAFSVTFMVEFALAHPLFYSCFSHFASHILLKRI